MKVIRENLPSQPGETSPPIEIKPIDRLVYIRNLGSQTLGKAERTEMSAYKHVCLLPTQVDKTKALCTEGCLFILYFLTGSRDETKGTARPMDPKLCVLGAFGFLERYDHGRWRKEKEVRRAKVVPSLPSLTRVACFHPFLILDSLLDLISGKDSTPLEIF